MVIVGGGKASTTSIRVYPDPTGSSSSGFSEIIDGARSERGEVVRFHFISLYFQ